MTVSARTLIAGVVGNPIGHSLSPTIHNAWLEAAGTDATYVAFPVSDEAGFDALVALGKSGGLRGINVTAPFKGRALALADQADPIASATGSANLLNFENGQARAFSTDGAGLMAALAEQAPALELSGTEVLMLGAGGAARGVIPDLLAAGVSRIVIRNRTVDNARALADACGPEVVAEDTPSHSPARLVINAVTGAHRHDFSTTPDARAALDMTYRPLRTGFLSDAEAAGVQPVDGLAMLIGQARPTFRHLFGVEPPAMDVRTIALARLESEA